MWCEAIPQERDCGYVRCAVVRCWSDDPYVAARLFGLSAPAGSLREVEASIAEHTIEGLLHYDMAYNREIVPIERARLLAHAFVYALDTDRTRFYTNGRWELHLDPERRT